MIEVKNVKKDFNEETKIHLKNLKFEDGKSYAILGVSGSRENNSIKYDSRCYKSN